MQRNDLPRIGVLSADAAAIAQFLRRIQALDAETAALLPLSPAAVPDCEPYLCGASTHAPLQKLSEAAEILAASGCTVIAVPDSAGIFCTQLTAAAGVPVLSTADAAMPQLVGALHQRVSILCTPGVRAANTYGLTAQRYGLQCSYPDAPVQALLGCVRPEKACSEQVLRSIIELELARGCDGVVLDSAQLCAAFAHFGLAARYPQVFDGMELLAQAALQQSAAASDARRAQDSKRLRAQSGARSRGLSDRECLLRVDVSVMVRARRVVGHIIDVGQHAAVIRQRRDGIGIGIADAKRPVTPDNARARDGVGFVRIQQCVAQQPTVAADLIERERCLLPRCARSPERRHCLRVRDRVGCVHVHGRQSRRVKLRHGLRDLRIRKIDTRARAVTDCLHNGLIPPRRRDGGVGLFPAACQQQRAQQAQ